MTKLICNWNLGGNNHEGDTECREIFGRGMKEPLCELHHARHLRLMGAHSLGHDIEKLMSGWGKNPNLSFEDYFSRNFHDYSLWYKEGLKFEESLVPKDGYGLLV